MSRFNAGNTLYDNAIPSGKDNAAGGLGPLYAGFSCRSCHMTTGRTAPSTWTNYDVSKADADGFVQVSGGTGFTSGLIYITRKTVPSSPTTDVCCTTNVCKAPTPTRTARKLR